MSLDLLIIRGISCKCRKLTYIFSHLPLKKSRKFPISIMSYVTVEGRELLFYHSIYICLSFSSIWGHRIVGVKTRLSFKKIPLNSSGVVHSSSHTFISSDFTLIELKKGL